MIYQLPTRSARRYRGKYPLRINSISYSSRSPEGLFTKSYLSLNSTAVHVELNEGSRFIVSADEFSGFDQGMAYVGEELALDTIQRAAAMHQAVYDGLLAGLNTIRDDRKAAMSGVIAS